MTALAAMFATFLHEHTDEGADEGVDKMKFTETENNLTAFRRRMFTREVDEQGLNAMKNKLMIKTFLHWKKGDVMDKMKFPEAEDNLTAAALFRGRMPTKEVDEQTLHCAEQESISLCRVDSERYQG